MVGRNDLTQTVQQCCKVATLCAIPAFGVSQHHHPFDESLEVLKIHADSIQRTLLQHAELLCFSQTEIRLVPFVALDFGTHSCTAMRHHWRRSTSRTLRTRWQRSSNDGRQSFEKTFALLRYLQLNDPLSRLFQFGAQSVDLLFQFHRISDLLSMVHMAHQLGMLIRDPVQIFLHAGQSLFQTQILRLQELTILLELPQREAKLAVLQAKLGAFWQIRQLLHPLALLHEPIPCRIAPLPACSHLHDGLSATQHDLGALFPERGFLLGRLQCLCDFLHFKL
mmetsp:Transcript_20343/g.42519  ORF Transcript_20343/g.42519 Transcript_20343/m.42519 type:complete len:280 (+) Transcript_20343:384-1223(+)